MRRRRDGRRGLHRYPVITVGPVTFAWVVDFYNGFEAPCNHVSEVATFALDDGTITMTSAHTDCLQHGNRVNTSLQVTGGTGATTEPAGRDENGPGSAASTPTFTYFGMISIGG